MRNNAKNVVYFVRVITIYKHIIVIDDRRHANTAALSKGCSEICPSEKQCDMTVMLIYESNNLWLALHMRAYTI